MLPFHPERRTPTYDLEEVQRLAGQGPISCKVTTVALRGAAALDLEHEHVIEAVLLLCPDDFYKTMPSDEVPGSWQDVYHLTYQELQLYIKLQISTSGLAVVIQFKRR